MKKLLLVSLAVLLVGCSANEGPIDMGDGIGDGTMGDLEAGGVEYFEGEYRLFDPLASRGDGEMCIMITQSSAGQLPEEFLTPDDGEFPAICLNDEDKDKIGLRETFDNLGDCKYSEVGNFYTINNLRIDPSREYEKRADLVSAQRFMGGSTSCE